MIIDFPNRRPSEEIAKAKHREIAKRYSAAIRKKLGEGQFAAIRISELARMVKHRYSGLPIHDSDDGVALARVMAHHFVALRDAARRTGRWCDRNAPWLGEHEIERLISEAADYPRRYKADELGWLLHVSAAERTQLKLTTIGAYDQTSAERLELRKAKSMARSQTRRDAKRSQASLADRTKPWEAEGVSRRTWYRRRGTNSERTIYLNAGSKLVPPSTR